MKKIICRVKAFLKDIQFRNQIRRVYSSDSRYQLQHLRGLCKDSKDKSDADIMLVMHALEKGMSFPVKKEGFGKEKSSALVDMLNKHISLYGIDRQVIVATNILNVYIHDSYSVRDVDVREKIKQYLVSNKAILSDEIGGVKKVSMPLDNPGFDAIMKFYESRTSVREYSEEPLSKEEINKAIELAMTTPSACNRQASRVYVVQEKKKIAEVMENQLGDQGWCNRANTLFVVTSVSTYFGSLYERKEPYIDGGMFAMNLVMGLHAQNIACCFKMYIRHPDIDKRIRNILSIPENEVPIILVLAGHYPDHKIKSPISIRNKINYEIQ